MRSPQATAARVALVYAVVAASWILLSDILLAAVSPLVLATLSPYKGLLFVAVTAAVLFVLVYRWAERAWQATSEAEALHAQLSRTLDALPVGVIVADGAGLVSEINPAALGQLDRTKADSVGHALEEVLGVPGRTRTGGGARGIARAYDGIEVSAAHSVPGRALVIRASAIEPGSQRGAAVLVLTDVLGSFREQQRAVRLAQGYRFLTEFSAGCSSAASERELLEEVVEAAVDRGGFDAAWAVVLNPATGHLEDVASVGLGEQVREVAAKMLEDLGTERESGPMPMVLRAGEVYVHNDLQRDLANRWSTVARDNDLSSAASFAITVGGEVRAAVTLFSRQPGYFERDEVALVSALQKTIALAFDRAALDRRRIEAEEQLSASEQAYRMVFEANPIPMWVHDLETLRFLAVNDAAVARYGWSREEFASMAIDEIWPADQVPRLLESVAAVEGGMDDSGVWLHTDKDGRAFPVRVISHVIDWEGRPAQLVMCLPVPGEESASASEASALG